jgi:hypothetical protein
MLKVASSASVLRLQPSENDSDMLKKLLIIAASFVLVSVQALSVNCDLRCSLIGAKHGHSLYAGMQMAHCHGMSMEQHEQTSVAANDCCSPTRCVNSLNAVIKNTAQNAEASTNPLLSAVVPPANSSGISNPSHPAAFLSLSRSGERPLELRPGVSLRI